MGKPDALFCWLDHRDKLYDNENVVLLKLVFLVAWVIEGMAFEDEEQGLLMDI